MKTLRSLVLVVSGFSFSSAFACGGTDGCKTIHASDLSAMVAKKEAKLTVVDVNNKETRSKYGIVPGAILLSSSSKFDVSKELPSDKTSKLVFYCANEKCQASHQAAKVAMKSGYSDVVVMSDGIIGWKKAGNPTTSFAN